MSINLDNFDTLSFDCYGTLVDWERGLLGTLAPLLEKYGHTLEADQLLEKYAQFEFKAQTPYQPYKEVLKSVVRRFAEELHFSPSPEDIGAFSQSVQFWPTFDDSSNALKALKSRYRLAVISNIDDKLFDFSRMKLDVEFDEIITSEQLHSYKPNKKNFSSLVERCGTTKERLLHVAQSRFHDIAPAKDLGISCVWIDRRSKQDGHGATLPSNAIADARFVDMKSFAKACGVL